MIKTEYYINVVRGRENNNYRKVSGYTEAVTDSKGISTLIIGYDKRDGLWRATELNTGLGVSRGAFDTKKECVEDVHGNIDIVVDRYNRIMADERYCNAFIKPFQDFVNTRVED